jgi:WD40 repeat protein
MSDLFISYAREDIRFVRALHDELARTKREAWVDWEGIPPTAEWLQEVYAAIDGADAFAFVISPDSVTSRVCGLELQHAIRSHKRLIPLLCREVPEGGVPEELAKINWLDFREQPDMHAFCVRLVEVMGLDLERIRTHTRLLVAATRWENEGREKSFFLRGRALAEAEAWQLKGLETPPQPTRLQAEFIVASRQAATRRQRTTLTAISVALGVTLLLAVVAIYQRNEKERQRQVAESRRRIAVSRQLAAQSNLERNETPVGLERSVLLAVESLKSAWTLEGSLALTAGLELLPLRPLPIQETGEVRNVALSPDGLLLATANRKTEIRLWDAQTGAMLRSLPASGVTAMTFSLDGQWMAAGTWAGVCSIWEISTGKLLSQVERRGGVRAVVASRDSQRIAASYHHGAVVVWEARTGRIVLELDQKTPVTAACFSPNGLRLAFGGDDKVVQIWDLEGTREVAHLEHQGPISVAKFSPDGHWLATGEPCVRDRNCAAMIRVWDANTGMPIAQVGSTDDVEDLAFTPDGERLTAATVPKIVSLDRFSIRTWNIETGREEATVTHAIRVTSAKFSPDARWLVTVAKDRTARLWDVATGREATRMIHGDTVETASFSSDGSRVATWSWDGVAAVWKVQAGWQALKVEHPQLGNLSGMPKALWNPEGTRLATVGMDGTARLWDAQTGMELVRIQHEHPVGDLMLSTDGRWAASAEEPFAAEPKPSKVLIWDTHTGHVLTNVVSDSNVKAMAVSPDSRLFPTGTVEGKVQVWEAASGRRVCGITHQEEVRALAFSPDGRWIASGEGCPPYSACPARVLVSSCSDGSKISAMTLEDGLRGLAFSPDGHWLVTGSSDGIIALWDPRNGTVIRRIDIGKNAVNVLLFSPDGRWLAAGLTAGPEGTISGLAQVWDAITGKEVARMADDWPVETIAISADSRWLATGTDVLVSSSSDRGWRARIWEIATGAEVARMDHEDKVLYVAFSPDGHRLLTASRDNAARIWYWQPEDLIAQACARLTRNLTVDEWAQYIGTVAPEPTCPDLPTPQNLPIPEGKRYLQIGR